MPQPYNDPNFNTTTGLINYVNEVTGHWATILIILASTVVIFIMMKTRGERTSDSLLVSFFLSFIFASFLWAAQLLAGKILVLWLLLSIGAGIWSMFDK